MMRSAIFGFLVSTSIALVACGGGGGLTYKQPSWSGTVNCGDCHKAGPKGGALDQDTGAHLKHVSTTQYGIDCYDCHENAGHQTPSAHANYQINVNINTNWGGTYGGSTTPGDAYSSCLSEYCHSTGHVPDRRSDTDLCKPGLG